MKVNLEQLEEMQKELFRQQCDLDIQKAMVKHFIKKKKSEQLNLTDVSQHRELLIDFSKKIMFGEDWTPPLPYEQMVDDYLKGN
jgi:phosphopantothenoylcysteine synthetase/decarboxylase